MRPDSATIWFAEQRVNGQVVARVGRRAGRPVAEILNVGTVLAGLDGDPAQFEAVAGLEGVLRDKVEASVVQALARHAEGEMTLHGGCVSNGTGALALVGPSGAGKSTTVAALCLYESLAVVADDTVALAFDKCDRSGVTVSQTQSQAWLLDDASFALGFDPTGRRKTAVPLSAPSHEPKTLRAVVALCFDDGATRPELHRLRGQDAFRVLSESVIRLVVDDPTSQLREFDRLQGLVANCPVYELRRSAQLDNLRECAKMLRGLFGRDIG